MIMTKAIHRISIKDETCGSVSNQIKEGYGAISDHLRNHVHLTNCIHLKNHMHRPSPNFAERSLMRDLIVLQKSRSLRDPSTSPPSWVSPYVVGAFTRKDAKIASSYRRRSIGVDRQSDAGRFSISSPHIASAATAKVTALEAAGDYYFAGEADNAEITKGDDTGGRSRRSNSFYKKQVSLKNTPIEVETQATREPDEITHGQIVQPKTFLDESDEVPSTRASWHQRA